MNPSQVTCRENSGLNESPSQKEGKLSLEGVLLVHRGCLNESPSQKEGKSVRPCVGAVRLFGLNESPSQKEGKFNMREFLSGPNTLPQ